MLLVLYLEKKKKREEIRVLLIPSITEVNSVHMSFGSAQLDSFSYDCGWIDSCICLHPMIKSLIQVSTIDWQLDGCWPGKERTRSYISHAIAE